MADEAAERGLWRENFAQAFDVIRAHRMRSGLLILGVAIGIMTILMMVTVLSGLGKKITKDSVSANRPYIYIQRFDLSIGGLDAEELARREPLERADALALAEECPSLDKVCYFIQPQGQQNMVVTYRSERTPPTQAFGTDHTMPDIYSLPIEYGRFFTETEVSHRERVVVLGYGPARDLFPHRDPIGRLVRFGGREYKVVGTFASRDHLAGSLSDNFIALPSTTYRKDLKGPLDFESISANVREGHTLEEGIDEITAVLRVRRDVGPGEENNFVVLTSESFINLVRRVTVPIGIVLTIIASIGLLVGGIGVMNIMLISVAERTREIGVRMALGARKQDIQQQFLVESSTLTGVGGVAGTVLGTLFAYLISTKLGFPFGFSVFWAVTAIVFSAGVGIIFGLYPARRASRMDPVEALRYE